MATSWIIIAETFKLATVQKSQFNREELLEVKDNSYKLSKNLRSKKA